MVDLVARLKKIFPKNSLARKVVGAILIILGLLALITPFSPGSWLIFIGLGFFGVRLAVWDHLKVWFNRKYNDRK